ncbi:MAG: V-type ATP synthase subunit F [Spirochaetes bacterium]|nr:V-type ATP synthase subunit F [Spirochaetota bacterium]
MKTIYILGDIHTVNVFKLAGITGIVTNDTSVIQEIKHLLEKEDSAIIIVTRELIEKISEEIHEINLHSGSSVIFEIPGIDDKRGFGTSSLEYITEALGVSI